jgi:hypothetical protein
MDFLVKLGRVRLLVMVQIGLQLGYGLWKVNGYMELVISIFAVPANTIW